MCISTCNMHVAVSHAYNKIHINIVSQFKMYIFVIQINGRYNFHIS